MHAKLAAPGRRRDISEGARPMGLSLPCRRQGGQYSRLPAESKERRCGGQGVLPQGAPHPRACSHQLYAGWLCCIASRSARDVERKRGMETPQAAIIEIPEQPESNYYVVFIKANSPLGPCASKTRLRPLSGTRSSLHRSILLQDLILPTKNICTRAGQSAPNANPDDLAYPKLFLPSPTGVKRRQIGLVQGTAQHRHPCIRTNFRKEDIRREFAKLRSSLYVKFVPLCLALACISYPRIM